MKSGYKLIFLALLAAIQQPAARADTLSAALAAAWARHPRAAAQAARADEVLARAELAEGLTPGPATLSLGHLNDGIASNRGREEWEVEMSAPLWLPGQRAARRGEADSALAMLAAQRAALTLELAGEVRAAWWALADARQTRDLAARRAASALALEADVLRRYQAGELARVDANLARGERLAAEADRLEVDMALARAEQALRALIGYIPKTLEGEGTAEESATEHPGPAVSAAAVQAARAHLNMARHSRRDAPELAVRVLRERGNFNDPFANAVGVKLSIPFSSGPRVAREDAAARAELDQAEAEHAQARHKLTLAADQARRELDAARQWLESGGLRRELTADNLRLAEKAFALGESDLTALLRARAAAFEAEALYHRRQVALTAAQSRLKQALGVLP